MTRSRNGPARGEFPPASASRPRACRRCAVRGGLGEGGGGGRGVLGGGGGGMATRLIEPRLQTAVRRPWFTSLISVKRLGQVDNVSVSLSGYT